GHAFAGRAFGLEPQIELMGFGGLTRFPAGRALSPGRSILVSAAGPAVGIAIGGVTLLVGKLLVPDLLPAIASIGDGGFDLGHLSPGLASGYVEYAALAVIWVNLGWGALNLLPMMPLDGGNILASALSLVSPTQGRIAARGASLLVALGIALWALQQGL